MESFGIRIMNILKESGMSQKQLAMKIGLTESALSRYISGERQPKPEVVANIATALCVTSDYLLGITPLSFNGKYVERIIAREAKNMTLEEKNELIKIMLGVN